MKATVTFEYEVDDRQSNMWNTFIAIGRALHYELARDPEVIMVVEQPDPLPILEFKGTFSIANTERGEMVRT